MSAVRLILPGGLGQNAISEGVKAFCKYRDGPPLVEGVPLGEMAGLQFPVALNPKPLTLPPLSYTLNPKPQTLSTQA